MDAVGFWRLFGIVITVILVVSGSVFGALYGLAQWLAKRYMLTRDDTIDSIKDAVSENTERLSQKADREDVQDLRERVVRIEERT